MFVFEFVALTLNRVSLKWGRGNVDHVTIAHIAKALCSFERLFAFAMNIGCKYEWTITTGISQLISSNSPREVPHQPINHPAEVWRIPAHCRKVPSTSTSFNLKRTIAGNIKQYHYFWPRLPNEASLPISQMIVGSFLTACESPELDISRLANSADRSSLLHQLLPSRQWVVLNGFDMRSSWRGVFAISPDFPLFFGGKYIRRHGRTWVVNFIYDGMTFLILGSEVSLQDISGSWMYHLLAFSLDHFLPDSGVYRNHGPSIICQSSHQPSFNSNHLSSRRLCSVMHLNRSEKCPKSRIGLHSKSAPQWIENSTKHGIRLWRQFTHCWAGGCWGQTCEVDGKWNRCLRGEQ